jgi:Cu2+-exporting ATPase
MDTLVALGSGASFVWSVYLVFKMALSNADAAHSYLHSLYFESAAMILALITVGKLLEAIAKEVMYGEKEQTGRKRRC